MSVSPQPAPQVPPLSRSPQNTPTSIAVAVPSVDSPAQLASILSNALAENENLKRELDKALLRADKAERRLAQKPIEGGADAAEHLARIADLEGRLSDALAERSELETRIKRLQGDWVDCNRMVQDAEAAAAAALAQFSNIIAARGGTIQPRNGAHGLTLAELRPR
jgi:chromosome segregation ATPase